MKDVQIVLAVPTGTSGAGSYGAASSCVGVFAKCAFYYAAADGTTAVDLGTVILQGSPDDSDIVATNDATVAFNWFDIATFTNAAHAPIELPLVYRRLRVRRTVATANGSGRLIVTGNTSGGWKPGQL